ncbi:hypothetical protein ABZT03_43600, partial [Streptomyces sp. NPDC005574]|uniref:hypothetical protein n=1 Tax=Streptomyces sp. NPDC005574 TaxID=3156891 RepID=UPI0033B18B5C
SVELSVLAAPVGVQRSTQDHPVREVPGRPLAGACPGATARISTKDHEDRRGLTALFWSNVNPYGTFRLDMDKRLDLGPAVTVPGPRATVDAAERSPLDKR